MSSRGGHYWEQICSQFSPLLLWISVLGASVFLGAAGLGADLLPVSTLDLRTRAQRIRLRYALQVLAGLPEKEQLEFLEGIERSLHDPLSMALTQEAAVKPSGS